MNVTTRLSPSFHIDCLKYYKGNLFSKEKTITDIRWPEKTKKTQKTVGGGGVVSTRRSSKNYELIY